MRYPQAEHCKQCRPLPCRCSSNSAEAYQRVIGLTRGCQAHVEGKAPRRLTLRRCCRAVLASPVRVGEPSLLLEPEQAAPGLRNCFNTGLCAWLCAHRRGLQWALGLETLALLGLLALYARLNRAAAHARALEEDADQVRGGPSGIASCGLAAPRAELMKTILRWSSKQ